MDLTIRPLDAIAVAAYLVAMLGIGAYCARRGGSAENYFVGRRNFPGWVVALSMFGTIVSSTTFLALPAAAYVLDWRQLTVNRGAVHRDPRGRGVHPVFSSFGADLGV